MKTISVIIPIYNRRKVLERCVNSVLAQTFTDFELILCDDGSNDGSAELCHGLSARDSRIYVSRIAHQGASAARNAGLLRATGEYIYLLDSDDIIAPNTLERLYEDILQTGTDMACCRFQLQATAIGDSVAPTGEVTVLSPGEAFAKMLLNEGELGYGVSTGTKLIKRSLITEPYPLYFAKGMVFGEDTLWTAELLERTENIAMDSSVMMCYSLDCENSVCRNVSLAARLQHNRWKLNYLNEHEFPDQVIEPFLQTEKDLLIRILLNRRQEQ